MPASDALNRAASTRHLLRRLGWLTLLGATATLSLSPLLLRAAWTGSSRVLLLLLLALYLACKGAQWLRTRRLLKQIRTEAAFVGQRLSSAELVGCLERRDHLWARSLTLRVLREARDHPFPGLLLVEEERRYVRALLRRAYERLALPYPYLGLLTWTALVGAATASGGAALWSLGGVLVMAPTAGLLELLALGFHLRLRRCLTQLEQALADWTMSQALKLKLPHRGRPYTHMLLYRSPPWFVPSEAASA